MSNSDLIAWVQDRAREHDRDDREIAKFREIEQALQELSRMKAVAIDAASSKH